MGVRLETITSDAAHLTDELRILKVVPAKVGEDMKYYFRSMKDSEDCSNKLDTYAWLTLNMDDLIGRDLLSGSG